MKRLGGASGGSKPTIRLDDNVGSYDLRQDGRSGEGRIQQARIDRIEASPFQVRRVFPEAEIESLAESIRTNGLIHEPRGRPHPSRPGWIELMPGEMRLRALRRLVEKGGADGVLSRDGEGNWLVPIKVDPYDDERAEQMVLSENLDRTDLSAWEWALAWQQRRTSLAERGLPAGIRDVAASVGKKASTIAEYLRVADGITREVLLGAGVVSDGDPDHRRMCRLPLAALLRVARLADRGVDDRADALLQELKREGDTAAAEVLAGRRRSSAARTPAARPGFQINIRQAIDTVPPRQAVQYLSRITPVVAALAERVATEIPKADAEEIARSMEEIASRLRMADT